MSDDDEVRIPFTITYETQSWKVTSDGARRTDVDEPYPFAFQAFDGGETDE